VQNINQTLKGARQTKSHAQLTRSDQGISNSSSIHGRRYAQNQAAGEKDKSVRRPGASAVQDPSEDEIDELTFDREVTEAANDFHHISINERGDHRVLRPLSSKGTH
jgi:hypothetical protein